MAARKRTTQVKPRRTATRRARAYRRQTVSSSLLDYFSFGESYTSLVLGIVVVIIASILLLSLFKTRPSSVDTQKGTSSTKTSVVNELEQRKAPQAEDKSQPQKGEKIYTVKPGDDLWNIAEIQYKDGYKWSLIAQANNLTNPSVINVGNELVIPEVSSDSNVSQIQPATPTSSVNQPAQPATPQDITGKTYVIIPGDDLWDIAIRAYGNGYRWVDIARVNNLTNPDLIHSGNTLTIPR